MTINRIAIAMMAVLVLPHIVGAQQGPKYWVYGSGGMSCGRWSSEVTVSQRNGVNTQFRIQRSSWVLGFVTGAGLYGPGSFAETDSDAIQKFVDNYCEQHPLDEILDASKALIAELRKR